MKYSLLGLCIALLTFGAVACGGSSSNDNSTGASPSETEVPSETSNDSPEPIEGGEGPVAIVNGEEIAREEFEEQLELEEASYGAQGAPFPQGAELAELQLNVVNQLVLQELVIQETESRNITATDEEIESEFEATAGSYPDEESFDQALEAEGLNQDDLRLILADNVRIEKLLDSVVEEAALAPPTEEELRELHTLISQQQELPPFEEVRDQLEAEYMGQRQNEVIQAFIQELQAGSNIEILI